jgi:hypothetical protein
VNAQYVHKRMGDRVTFIGVNFSDQRSGALELLELEEVSFPAVGDRSGGIAARFGVVGMPSTVYVDAAGRVVGRVHGLDTQMTHNIRRYLGVTPVQ